MIGHLKTKQMSFYQIIQLDKRMETEKFDYFTDEYED